MKSPPPSPAQLGRLVEQLQRENLELRSRASTESHSRLMVEEALGASEGRLKLAMDAAQLAFWEWDIGAQTVFTSAQFGELIDDLAADQEWQGPEMMAKVRVADQAALRSALIGVLKGQSARLDVEFAIPTERGEVWLECIGEVTARNPLGLALRMVGVVREVTRRREAQHQLEQARAQAERARGQAEAANAAKDEFLANISHEIRTPLNGVIGMNNLLAQTRLNAEQRQYVDLLGSSGRALLALVNDVLDYSRIEAHKLLLEQVRFPLERWIWEAVTPQRVAAQAKGLELVLTVDQHLPKEVVGDPGRLRQVVTNLVNNAIKFTQQGKVEVTMQLAAEERERIWIVLEVRDSGIGIDPDKQRSIFDAFVQADTSTSRRYGGTGLGLSICAKLVQLMGGSIDLHSAPGQGSRFVVQVPLQQAHEGVPATQLGFDAPDPITGQPGLGATQGSESLPPAGASVLPPWAASAYRGQRALVVDDHPVNQLLATKLLEGLGFEVLVAANGLQAVEQATQQAFDLILMDIQMPQLNGLKATTQIRAWERQRAQAPTPIVAVTASASDADRQLALASGMNAYVSKPLTPEALYSALRQATASTPGLESPDSNNHHSRSLLTPGGSELSRQRLLSRLGGDEAALRELTQAFCDDLRQRMGLAYQSLKDSDWPALQAQAHALKGALMTITAEAVAIHAKTLEDTARAHNAAASMAAFASLSKTAQDVFNTVKTW